MKRANDDRIEWIEIAIDVLYGGLRKREAFQWS